MQIDPLAQLYADETPYHYAGNNPVLFNDPLGDKVSGGNMFSRMYDGFHAWQYGRSAEGFASWMDDAGFGGFGGEATGQGYFIGKPVEEIWMVSRYKNEDGSAGDIIDEYFDHYVYEEQAENVPRPYTFEVLHSAKDSFGWDWFLETTVKGNVTTKTAVIITYNTNKKDLWTSKYGQVVNFIGSTKVITRQADGTVTTDYLKYRPTDLMVEWIQGAKDYHCGGCLTGPSVLDKYLDFIFQKDSNSDFWGRPKTHPTGNGVDR